MSASPGLAGQTGKAALDDWLRSDLNFGSIVTYASATEDGDTLIVRDLQGHFSTRIAPGRFQTLFEYGSVSVRTELEDVDLTMTFRAPEMVVEKLASDVTGFSFQSLSLPKNAGFVIEIEAANNDKQIMEGRLEGYETIEAFYPRQPKIGEDPERPVSRWLPLLRIAEKTRIREQRIGRLAYTMEESPSLDTPVSVTHEQHDLVFNNLEDGKIATVSSGPWTQVSSTTTADGIALDIRQHTESTRLEDYDISAMLLLLDPAAAVGQDYRTFIGAAELTGYAMEAGAQRINVGRVAYDNIGVRPPRHYLVDTIDSAIAAPPVDPRALTLGFVDMLRSFAVGRLSIEGLRIASPDPSAPGGVRELEVDEVVLSNLNADGLGALTVLSLRSDLPGGGAMRLKQFSLGDLEFAPFGPIETFIETMPPEPPQSDMLESSRLFMPRSISVSMTGLEIAEPQSGEYSIDNYLINLKTTVPPIPNDIDIRIEGLEAPLYTLEDRDAIDFMRNAGIDRLRFGQALRMRWDEQTEDIVVDDLMIEMGDVARLSGRARLGGVPKYVVENPARFQAALATANLKSAELELVDHGGTDTVLDIAAQRAGTSKTRIVSQWVQYLQSEADSLGNDAFTSMVSDAARRFFDNPKNVRIIARPERPVPILQVLANSQLAPGTLPDLLGLAIEANR